LERVERIHGGSPIQRLIRTRGSAFLIGGWEGFQVPDYPGIMTRTKPNETGFNSYFNRILTLSRNPEGKVAFLLVGTKNYKARTGGKAAGGEREGFKKSKGKI